MSAILFIGKKLESSKKIKDELPVEPSFKVRLLYWTCTVILLAPLYSVYIKKCLLLI